MLNIYDPVANDSDKTFQFGGMKVQAVFVTLVTTATVGNRRMRFGIYAADNTLLYFVDSGAVQAASLTRYYSFGFHLIHEAAFGGPSSDHIHIPIPEARIPNGGYLRIWDSAAIAAAADDMTVWAQAND